MSANNYIPNAESQGIFKDKGSKFFAYLYPFKNVDDLKSILNHLKKSNSKAVHFCFAYRIGNENNIIRVNDDGEPSGSAGKPIFGQIEKFSATDILIVVVRYFGGTLLGVPGLINAYKNAANDALLNTKLIEKINYIKLHLTFSYEIENFVMILLKKINPEKIKFLNKTEIEIEIESIKEEFFYAEANKIWQLEVKKIILQ